MPKQIKTNQYGNLPKAALAKLRGKPDIFIGAIKTKSGEVINGVWQRPYIRPDQKVRGKSTVPKGANTTGKLKLLIRFADAQTVKKKWGYHARAKSVIAATFNTEFTKAMAKAMESGR